MSQALFTFLIDVDNTLLDNDAVKRDMRARTLDLLGEARATAFWDGYEETRRECDFVDFPRTLARYRERFPDDPQYANLAAFVLGYPYETSLFPGALATLAHLNALGPTVVISDGDPVFQPAKIGRSGIADAVDGRVLVTVHKEDELEGVLERYPADRYVLIDDKPSILASVKGRYGERVCTVHVHQGKYASAAPRGSADIEVGAIIELAAFSADRFARSR